MITLEEAAAALNVSKRTVYNWGLKGVAMPFYRDENGRKYCKLEDVEAHLKDYKRLTLANELHMVKAYRSGACVWSAARRGTIEQILLSLFIYPSLANCVFHFD